MVFFQTLRNDGFFCQSMVKGWRGTLGISLAVSTVLETMLYKKILLLRLLTFKNFFCRVKANGVDNTAPSKAY